MSVIKKLKDSLRPLTPKPLMNAFHYAESRTAQTIRRNPTGNLIVIGVVGSKGKTTTANLLWSVLSATGSKAGQIGTANIRIGGHEEMNPYHQTMPGAFILQRLFARMLASGCKYVVLEVPSEGQTQYRHIGINFDLLIFTNVEPEFLAAHNNSLETLHKHNKRVFGYMAGSKRKVITGKRIPKIIVANADSAELAAYTDFAVDKKVSYSVNKPSNYQARDIKSNSRGNDFTINDIAYHINLLGSINVINAAAAVAAGRELNVLPAQIQHGFDDLTVVPGRLELIDEGQAFSALVDYAHTQVSMTALMQSALDMRHKGKKIIVLLGAEGGGRDVKKRPEMGQIVGKVADCVIVSNVDPYEDDPTTIIEDIAAGAEKAGKKRDKDLFLIEDRRVGIRKALKLASKDDLVLITGKGAEQSIIIGGQSKPWDDRKVVREELAKLGYKR